MRARARMIALTDPMRFGIHRSVPPRGGLVGSTCAPWLGGGRFGVHHASTKTLGSRRGRPRVPPAAGRRRRVTVASRAPRHQCYSSSGGGGAAARPSTRGLRPQAAPGGTRSGFPGSGGRRRCGASRRRVGGGEHDAPGAARHSRATAHTSSAWRRGCMPLRACASAKADDTKTRSRARMAPGM